MISIIIPNFNKASFIEETLLSIKNQSFSNFECIIVDDSSTDDSVIVINKIIKTDKRFRLISYNREKKMGPAISRKEGFLISNFPYVCFFDSDDIMTEFCLEKRFNKIIQGNYDFVSCGLSRFYESIDNAEKIPFISNGDMYTNQLIGKSSYYAVGNLWKKKFLVDNNLFFKTNEIPLEDYSMNLRALRLSDNYFHIEENLIFYRRHENSISAELANLNEDLLFGEFKVRRKFFNNILLGYPEVYSFYIKRLLWIYRGLLLNKSLHTRDVFFEILRVYLRNFRLFGIFKFISISILVKILNRGIHKIR